MILFQNRKGAIAFWKIFVLICIIAVGVFIWFMFFSTMVDRFPDIKRIEVEPQAIRAGDSQRINVTVFDELGNKLKGASVSIDGCGIVPQKGETDANGRWTSQPVKPNLEPSEPFGTITVTVTYTWNHKVERTTEITVTRN